MKLNDDIKESLVFLRRNMSDFESCYEVEISPDESEVVCIRCYAEYDIDKFKGIQIEIYIDEYLLVLTKFALAIVNESKSINFKIPWDIIESDLFQLSTVHDVYEMEDINFFNFYYILLEAEYSKYTGEKYE